MKLRTIAIAWSGAASGAARTIWLAEAMDGQIVCLENGRGREDIAAYLIGEGRRTSNMVVGFDFAFSLPSWYLESRGFTDAPALWKALAVEGERLLAGCEAPFWGRTGRGKANLPDEFRRTDREARATGGIRPNSVFQIGGAGAVGTGSLRGMPILKRLRDAGFSVWPFDAPTWPCVIEIYPRLLAGPVNKTSQQARADYLVTRYPSLAQDMRVKAASSEDAFDAAVSALAVDVARKELEDLAAVADPQARREGWIWAPINDGLPAREHAPPRGARVPRASVQELATWRQLVQTMLPKPVVQTEPGSFVGGEPGESRSASGVMRFASPNSRLSGRVTIHRWYLEPRCALTRLLRDPPMSLAR